MAGRYWLDPDYDDAPTTLKDVFLGIANDLKGAAQSLRGKTSGLFSGPKTKEEHASSSVNQDVVP